MRDGEMLKRRLKYIYVYMHTQVHIVFYLVNNCNDAEAKDHSACAFAAFAATNRV